MPATTTPILTAGPRVVETKRGTCHPAPVRR